MSDPVIDVHIHFRAKEDPASGCYWSKEFKSGIAFFVFRLVTSSLFHKMDIGYITKHLFFHLSPLLRSPSGTYSLGMKVHAPYGSTNP